MIIHKELDIQLGEAQIKQLKSHYRQVIRHLEEGFPLKMKVLEALKNGLSGIVNESSQWQEVLKALHDSDDQYCIRLVHQDNEILNLPWSMAVDNKSQKQLGNIERLYLTKSIPGSFEEKVTDFPKAPAPLKILVMISSPEDSEWENRLSYEEEEYAILRAFEPLMHKGAVEVDFTEDGSLEALERKLKTNKYHILHFSGHAVFREKDKTGYIQLENQLNLNTHMVSAQDFANAVNCHPQHRVPMVMLSSCQTAQGSTEEGLRGITNHLIEVGVPVVISMGMAVKDYYAALFSAHFYRQLTEKQTILSAFHAAVQYLREDEFTDLKNAGESSAVPLQWIIPNLYLSQDLEEVVDWNQPEETLSFSSQRYILGQDRILLEHDKDYRFIGRRKDKAEILGPFFKKVPILLKGQGGVGKTAMAEHLVQRLIAKEPKTVPFLFDESIRSIKEILNALQDFLVDQGHERVIANVNLYEKAMDKFQHLIFQVKETHQPIFVFDNLESFQKEPGKDFADEYSDVKEVIAYLCERKICHVILTCRYPVPGFNIPSSFDLNQVGFNDFWKKCLYMDVGDIHIHLREKASFAKALDGFLSRPGLQYIDVAKLLHGTFGGNYRALEFFDRLVKENPDKIMDSLDSLEKFNENAKETAGQVKHQMGQNLLFSQLMSLLSPEQQAVLVLLSHFRIPVQDFALQLQIVKQKGSHSIDFKPILKCLSRLTLVEITIDQKKKLLYYYVTPIVKNLLKNHPKIENLFTFSHEQAGIYYYQSYNKINKDLTLLDESFYHFHESRNKDKVQIIGALLSNFYYKYYMYHKTFFYASRVYQLLGNETGIRTLNFLGLMYRLYGNHDLALNIFQKAQARCLDKEDKAEEVMILNNISQIFHDRSDYNTALKYLEQVLKIERELSDKSGEGTALNNISQIYQDRGDYNTALKYQKQCLKIFQKAGNKSGEGALLSNIGRIYKARSDYDTALKYYEQSLKVSRELGDRFLEGACMNNISQVYQGRGDYASAITYLENALKIFQEIGSISYEGITLNNISLIYSEQGEYDTALKYLKQSLKISKGIGDKAQEAKNLNNMSLIYSAWRDYNTALKYLEKSLKINREIEAKDSELEDLKSIGKIYAYRSDYKTALKYFGQSLEISQEIGDKSKEGMILNNISEIYHTRGDYDTALKYLEQSLKIIKELKDKEREISTLNSLAVVLCARGDYDTALKCLEKNLKIAREIEDNRGLPAILHNMAAIAYRNDDMEKFMEYEMEAYHTAVEINDLGGIYNIGKYFGKVLYKKGYQREGITMLKRSYEIEKEARYLNVGEIEKFLREIGEL